MTSNEYLSRANDTFRRIHIWRREGGLHLPE